MFCCGFQWFWKAKLYFCVCRRLHVPRTQHCCTCYILASAACFPALSTGCMQSYVRRRFVFFWRLDNDSMLFRAYHKLHAYPRSATSACFSTLCTAGLHVLLRLAPIICTFSRAEHRLPKLTNESLQNSVNRSVVVTQWVYFRFGFLTAITNLLRDSDTTNSSKAIDMYILISI